MQYTLTIKNNGTIATTLHNLNSPGQATATFLNILERSSYTGTVTGVVTGPNGYREILS